MVAFHKLESDLTKADIFWTRGNVLNPRSIKVRPHSSTTFEVYEDGDVELYANGTRLIGPRFFHAVDIIRKHVMESCHD